MRSRLLFLALLYFPGTVLHEMSHYIAAKLLFVRTGKISLRPKFYDDGLELGHIEIAHTDFVRRFIIGIAPLVVGILTILGITYLLISISFVWWQYILFAYAIITIVNTMSLSKSDLVGAWKIVLVLALALVFVVALH